MSAQFQTFKGAPRWRDRQFWLVLAVYLALVALTFYCQESWFSILSWTPLYLTMLLPPRLFLGEKWLFYLCSTWTSCRLQRFERIESYTCAHGADKNGNVQITLILLREGGPRSRVVWISIQDGAQLDALIAAMQTRGVLSLDAKIEKTFTELEALTESFSTHFANLEAEREALYRLLGRPMPKN